jgi:hypothetical protein
LILEANVDSKELIDEELPVELDIMFLPLTEIEAMLEDPLPDIVKKDFGTGDLIKINPSLLIALHVPEAGADEVAAS